VPVVLFGLAIDADDDVTAGVEDVPLVDVDGGVAGMLAVAAGGVNADLSLGSTNSRSTRINNELSAYFHTSRPEDIRTNIYMIWRSSPVN
jgi:hypothetical protein